MDSAPKKKPGLALVISMGKGKPGMKDEPDGDKGGDDESFSAAADELFDALKNDDREAFKDALQAVVMSAK